MALISGTAGGGGVFLHSVIGTLSLLLHLYRFVLPSFPGMLSPPFIEDLGISRPKSPRISGARLSHTSSVLIDALPMKKKY